LRALMLALADQRHTRQPPDSSPNRFFRGDQLGSPKWGVLRTGATQWILLRT
jgi:hypothetical protein